MSVGMKVGVGGHQRSRQSGSWNIWEAEVKCFHGCSASREGRCAVFAVNRAVSDLGALHK